MTEQSSGPTLNTQHQLRKFRTFIPPSRRNQLELDGGMSEESGVTIAAARSLSPAEIGAK